MEDVGRKKCSDKLLAFEMKIPVSNGEGIEVGCLVPIGSWIFTDSEILASFVKWRNKFNRMFPTREAVNTEKTRKYIEVTYINKSDSILFLIYAVDGSLIGHVGLARLAEKEFEVVNLIRGGDGGDRDLIYFAERSLIEFGFAVSECETCFVEIMSYNWLASDLHQRVGFRKAESYYLRKLVSENLVEHRVADWGDKTVDYTIDRYILAKQSVSLSR